MIKSLENINTLKCDFEYKNRLIRMTVNDNNEYFKFETPLLKVLKPTHITTNKKKNIEKKYIILEINENYNINNELDEFIILINKLHEISQENVKKNSISWFNTEFDEYGLDSKVKRPIDKQKDKQFIKILIPNDNKELNNKIEQLEKDTYISASIFYKGLKVSNDYLMGEYELLNLITQEEKENEYFMDNNSYNDSYNEEDLIGISSNDDILIENKEILNEEKDLIEIIDSDKIVENNDNNTDNNTDNNNDTDKNTDTYTDNDSIKLIENNESILTEENVNKEKNSRNSRNNRNSRKDIENNSDHSNNKFNKKNRMNKIIENNSEGINNKIKTNKSKKPITRIIKSLIFV